MQITTSKLTKKYQATVPEAVRQRLHLKAGDSILFEIDKNVVKLRKAEEVDLMFAHAVSQTLGEWASQEDDEAYSDL